MDKKEDFFFCFALFGECGEYGYLVKNISQKWWDLK